MRIFMLIVLMAGSLYSFTVQAQDEPADSDTWYVWIDTEITRNGESKQLISKDLITITCCVKSAKYRKFVKKTAKWIIENYDNTYSLESSSLQKIQDLELAEQMVKKKQLASNVLIAEYAASCK